MTSPANSNYRFRINLILTLTISLISLNIVIAQKLPNKQTLSVRAGADMKADGKLSDANRTFQAYNTATETFYTISNDDANLYLTLQAGHMAIIRRILNGGLTLTVKSTDKKSTQSVSVDYPIYEGSTRMAYVNKVVENMRAVDPPADKLDSLAKVNNDRMALRAKSIKVFGIANVDTLISVYNEDGIKAVGGFDNKLNYIYELAIPLKYISALLTTDKKFSYQVKINETTESGVTKTFFDDGRIKSVSIKAGAVMGQDATDFWAEYTLAK